MQGVDKLQKKLTTIQRLEHLNKIDIFAQLGPQELLSIANHCEQVEYAAGDTIFNEGDKGSEVFALISGSVELFRNGIQVARVKLGESFGTLSVLSDQPRLVSARATENSLCLKIESQSFWELLEDYPAMTQSVLKLLAQRIRVLAEPAQPTKV